MSRTHTVEAWLHAHLPAGEPFTLAPASEDASFRRYFRVTSAAGTLIVMDAPPEHEDCRPFVKVARLFRAAGVHVPAVLAEDLDNGFCCCPIWAIPPICRRSSDADRDTAVSGDAIAALVRIQLASRAGVLPEYDRALLLRELDLFPDWYVAQAPRRNA